MTKQDQKFQRIEEAKERFRKLSSDRIRELLNSGYVNEEGQIAYREVLQERGEWPVEPADLKNQYEETRRKLDEIEESALLKRHFVARDEDDT